MMNNLVAYGYGYPPGDHPTPSVVMGGNLHGYLLPIVAIGGLVWAGTLFIPVQGQSIGRRIAEWTGWLFFILLYARMSKIAPGTAEDHARLISGALPHIPTSRSGVWIVLYVVCEFVAIPLALVYLAITEPESLAITRSRLLVGSLAAVVIFYAYPVSPPWSLSSGVAGYGSFPSLHVAEAWIIASCVLSRKYAIAWTSLVALVVIISRNHYTMDVVSGAILAVGVCGLIRHGRAVEMGIA